MSMICPICGSLISKRFPVHQCKPVYISGLYSRKQTPEGYQRADYISETTHQEFCFVIYNDPDDTGKGWTTYTGTFSNEFLFGLLKERLTKEVVEGDR